MIARRLLPLLFGDQPVLAFAGVIVSVVAAGCEGTLPINRCHGTLRTNLCHGALPINRAHGTIPEED